MTKSMTQHIATVGTVQIDKITRHNGVAGQVSVEVRHTWTYDDGTVEHGTGTLVGSTYGGPLVYVTSGGSQCFVRNPERFGRFAPDPVEYARRYFLGLGD